MPWLPSARMVGIRGRNRWNVRKGLLTVMRRFGGSVWVTVHTPRCIILPSSVGRWLSRSVRTGWNIRPWIWCMAKLHRCVTEVIINHSGLSMYGVFRKVTELLPMVICGWLTVWTRRTCGFLISLCPSAHMPVHMLTIILPTIKIWMNWPTGICILCSGLPYHWMENGWCCKIRICSIMPVWSVRYLLQKSLKFLSNWWRSRTIRAFCK